MPDTEQEMFESALSDEAPAIVQEQPEVKTETVEAQPEAQQKSDDKPRDDKGRFAPKTEKAPEVVEAKAQEPPVEKTEDKPERGEIPAWRLREEADAKREWQSKAEQAERRAQEIEQQLRSIQRQMTEKQNPPPDIFADPEGYQRHQAQTFQQQLRQRDVATSEMFARLKFGDEVYDKAEKALESHVRLNPSDPIIHVLQTSAQPALEMVTWFRQQETQQRLAGKTLDDLLKEEREKALSDPAFLAQAIEKAKAAATPVHPQANTNIPSLNRATASVTQNSADDDESDASLFKRTIRS